MSTLMTDSSGRLVVNIYGFGFGFGFGHPHQQLQHLTYQLPPSSYSKASHLDA